MTMPHEVKKEPQVGATFGRYRVESLLGQGGMGRVFRAQDTLLRRTVALKVVLDDARPDAIARLLREARAAAALHHPNAVTVWDAGEVDGIPYIAMELAQGVLLREKLRDPSISVARRLRWLEQIARALDAAHDVGIVHRDVKPENVIVCADDSVKVLDFGIARRASDEPDDASARKSQPAPVSFRTAEGHVVGTPRYMAPEQLRGESLDGRTDQFAWGLVAYELLSGAHPLREGALEAPPPLLSEVVPGTSFELSALIARALARKPSLRHPSMASLADALARLAVDLPDVVGTRAAAASEKPSEETTRETSASKTNSSGLTSAPSRERFAKPLPAPASPRRAPYSRWATGIAVAVVMAGAGLWLGAARRASRGTAASSSTAGTTGTATPPSIASATSAPGESASGSVFSATSNAAPAPPTKKTSVVAPATAPPPKSCSCEGPDGRLCPKDALAAATACHCLGRAGELRLCMNPPGPMHLCGAADFAGYHVGAKCGGFSETGAGPPVWAEGFILSCTHKCSSFVDRGVGGAACTGYTLDGNTHAGTIVCR